MTDGGSNEFEQRRIHKFVCGDTKPHSVIHSIHPLPRSPNYSSIHRQTQGNNQQTRHESAIISNRSENDNGRD